MPHREDWNKKIPRTGAGLRDALFAQLERLRDGSIEPMEAAAFANIAQAIVKSAQVEISYYRARKAGEIPDHAELSLVEKTALPSPDANSAKSANPDKRAEKC